MSSKNFPSSSSLSWALKSGNLAPDFILHTTPNQTALLKDFQRRSVILAFYPADFSPVCGDE